MTIDELKSVEETAPPQHTVVLPRVSTDPLDELVDRVRPALARAVDALQVAAALEADGCTDRVARVEYGFPDVFALAAEVFRRLGPPAEATAEPAGAAHGWRAALRLLAHGPLYALPAAVFPAVLAVLDQRAVIPALVVAGVFGWTAAGSVAFAAYRLLGSYRPGAAARLLRVTLLAAPAAGALAGLAVAGLAGGGWGLVLLCACQLAYQLAGTVLMFYRREALQAAAMAPAVLAGLAYLAAGPAMRPAALVTAAAGLAAAFAFALLATRGHGENERPARADLSGLAGVTWYGLCSAVLLLHASAPYLNSRLDLAIAVAPLILAMGFVEWRAERFQAEAVGLTRRSHSPREFGHGMWWLIGRETLACLAVPAALGLVLLAGLDAAGRLTGPGALMVAAHVVLGGAYYSAFVLAGFERFGWLCACLLTAMAAHVGIGAWLGAAPLLGRTSAPTADTALYLGSTLALLGLFLLGLRPILGQVRHYR
ncbi:hypothetical protein [Actinoplanes subtropicus]|uniref:hypothetical protein n=1 Tax=Actinoplanes subtropicus TaxID=543632 RepID=UPI0004C30A24|nr:hypothetical protein [Actinoplanes subtropicus]